jgi:hypothetical protein
MMANINDVGKTVSSVDHLRKNKASILSRLIKSSSLPSKDIPLAYIETLLKENGLKWTRAEIKKAINDLVNAGEIKLCQDKPMFRMEENATDKY